jgi:biopolymer transport protein ExbD
MSIKLEEKLMAEQIREPRTRKQSAVNRRSIFVSVTDSGKIVVNSADSDAQPLSESTARVSLNNSVIISVSSDDRISLKGKKLRPKDKTAPTKEGYAVVSLDGDGKVFIQEREIKSLPRRGQISLSKIREAVKTARSTV